MPHRKPDHNGYVFEQSKGVLMETRFKRGNPDHIDPKPGGCDGMTGLDPDARFDKPKTAPKPMRQPFKLS